MLLGLGRRAGARLETAWLSVHHGEGNGSHVVTAHHGLHAAVRSNRLDVHRATWISLKASR